MNILFVLPHPKVKGGILYTFTTYPSLTLKQLAAITPPQHKVELVDERCQKIPFNRSYDIVGISALTYNAPRAYEIADEFRRRGVPVVLGGYHPTALPEEAKQHADAVVIGEAEETWPQLLQDVEQVTLKPFYRSLKGVDPSKIPPAAHDAGMDIPFIESIQATRGCPNNCQFCAIHTVEGSLLRERPVEQVVRELESIKKKHLFFADASLTIHPEYSKALFSEMRSLDKTFDCCGNINVLARDEEFLKLAREAGCNLIQVGFESVSQETINAIGKRTNKVEMYDSAVKKIEDYGIMVMGLFMFGFDTDNPDIFNHTLDAIYRWDIDRARFSVLTPFPGAALFNRYEQEGRILTKDWSKYDFQKVVFQPKQMSVRELAQGTQYLVEEFHSLKNSLRRSFTDENFSLNRFFTRTFRDFSSRRYYKTFGGFR